MDITYDITATLRAQNHGHSPIVLCIENHPNDSRCTIHEDGICQSLTGRMGTGGGNVPLVLIYEDIQSN